MFENNAFVGYSDVSGSHIHLVTIPSTRYRVGVCTVFRLVSVERCFSWNLDFMIHFARERMQCSIYFDYFAIITYL